MAFKEEAMSPWIKVAFPTHTDGNKTSVEPRLGISGLLVHIYMLLSN